MSEIRVSGHRNQRPETTWGVRADLKRYLNVGLIRRDLHKPQISTGRLAGEHQHHWKSRAGVPPDMEHHLRLASLYGLGLRQAHRHAEGQLFDGGHGHLPEIGTVPGCLRGMTMDHSDLLLKLNRQTSV